MSDDTTVRLLDIKLELNRIEDRIRDVGHWNQYERWKSGRLLIQLRNPETNYLPKGQLASAAATLKTNPRELSDRMRVADTYRTDAQFKKAAQGRSWTQILRTLEPTREARTGPTRSKNWRQVAYEALGHLLARHPLTDEGRQILERAYDYLEQEGGD